MGPIAAFAFKEALRRRLVAVAVVLSLIFLLLFALAAARLQAHLPGGGQGLLGGLAAVLIGLYLASPLPALLAVLSAAGAISSEVESGAMQAVLARPVRRVEVVLGKYLGIGAFLVAYTLLLQGAVLVIARLETGAALAHPLPVLALLCLEPLSLAAVTLLGSTFLSTVAGGAAAILLYGLSSVGGVLEQIGAVSGTASLRTIGIVTSLMMPADAIYRLAAAIAGRGAGGAVIWQFIGPAATLSTPSGAMVVYAVFYVLAAVAGAAWVFTRRDI